MLSFRPLRMASALLMALTLSACATMSPQECRVANWSDVGLRDGLEGQPLALLGTRVSDCGENGVRVDSTAYLKGRESGLRSYCRLENAVPLGLNGGSYAGVCPPQIDGEFRRRFLLGYNVYAAHGEMARIDGRIQSVERRLRTLDHDEDRRLHDADEDRRLHDADKDDERRRIRREIDDERRHLRDELRDLDRQLRRARDYSRDAEWALDRQR